MFGQLPIMTIPHKDKSLQLSQAQSILRYYGQLNKGKNGEILYPIADRTEHAYQIDAIMEASDGVLAGLSALLKDNIDTQFAEFLKTTWANFLTVLEKQLKKNSENSKKFLVGSEMTLADIAAGQHMLRLIYNKSGER